MIKSAIYCYCCYFHSQPTAAIAAVLYQTFYRRFIISLSFVLPFFPFRSRMCARVTARRDRASAVHRLVPSGEGGKERVGCRQPYKSQEAANMHYFVCGLKVGCIFSALPRRRHARICRQHFRPRRRLRRCQGRKTYRYKTNK